MFSPAPRECPATRIWPSVVSATPLAKSSEPKSVIVTPLVAERGVDLAGAGVAHERDVAVDGAGDHDPPVAGLDDDGARDVRPRSQIGRDDPVAAEARVERAVAEVAGQREVVVRAQRARPGGEPGDDDLAVGLHGDRVGLVDLTGEVGLDDAAVSEAGDRGCRRRGSGRRRSCG